MNALTLLRSVEELLYEVVSWLVFYPKTLWMTLSRPLRTMAYSDREQRDKPDQQYLDTLSPPLFLVLSILLAHGIEIVAGLNIDQSRTAIGKMITSNDQTLLAVRALMFSLYPLAYAGLWLFLGRKRIDRETLRPPFFAQCFLSGALAILISLGTIGIRYPSDVATLAGLCLIGVTVVWFLWVQTRWLARVEGVGGAAAVAGAEEDDVGQKIVFIKIGLLEAPCRNAHQNLLQLSGGLDFPSQPLI